jgi:hypothetical protein
MHDKSWFAVTATIALLGGQACGVATGDASGGGDEASNEATGDLDEASQALSGGHQAFARVDVDGTVLSNFSHNSGIGAITRTKLAVGNYTVRFPGLGAPTGATVSGNVQVVALGPDSRRCKVTSWENDGNALLAGVRCHQGSTLRDSAFVIRFQRKTSGNGLGAYFRTTDPGDITPTIERSWISTGQQIFVDRTGTGAYTVLLSGLGGMGSAVQVTAMDTNANYCKVLELEPGGSAERIRVTCFDSIGSDADTRFSLSYIGNSASVGAGNRGAFVRADQPDTLNLYAPIANWSRNSGTTTAGCTAANAALWHPSGFFSVLHENLPEIKGSPHVAAYGTGNAFCKLVSWQGQGGGVNAQVNIQCYAPQGTTTKVQFQETYSVATGRTPC